MNMERTYWSGNGECEGLYQEMKYCDWQFTKKTQSVFRSYYRYFNDGDFPGWARKDWSLRLMGRWGWELNEKGLEMQEQRVTDAINYEYERFYKATRGN